MLLGVRQCGKTYIIRDFCNNNYDAFKEINLLVDVEIVNLYEQNINSSEKYMKLKAILDFDIENTNNVLLLIKYKKVKN